MADPPDSPTLFLSHSGVQKGFVESLYREFVRVNHSPFFDQDPQSRSLPKGTHFPSRIFDACRSCKLGVVVLSHDFMESMWPMLELQQFFFHNPRAFNNPAPDNIFPVFYKLKPADLRNRDNLERWKRSWEEQVPSWHESNRDWYGAGSSNFKALTLDMDRWPQAIQRLSHQAGEIFHKDELAFIQAIVSNICGRFPPPELFKMGKHFKGAELIQAEIHELFQKQQHVDHNIVDEESSRSPLAVGLYGVGGSGKTTVCNYMLQFYNRQAEYTGSCCFIEFPTKEADINLLKKSLKNVLSKRENLQKTTLEGIQSVEEAMPHIERMLSRYKVFLIIDNVWEWSLLIANDILRMEFVPGSRLLVTARSEDWLHRLSSNSSNLMLAMQILHVPSISEEEAIEALKAYSLGSLQELSNIDGHLRSLAKLCFFSRQCYPLLLETVGKRLRSRGRQLSSAEDWAHFYSLLEVPLRGGGEVEDRIVNVLRTSYDALDSVLKNTFLKLGTCIPKMMYYGYLPSIAEWLSKVSDDGSHTANNIRSQLLDLKYHGLIQIDGEHVVIHDIQMMLIYNLVQERNGEPKCFFLEGGMSSLSAEEFVKLRYIYEDDAPDRLCFDISCPQTMSGPQLEVFHLEGHSASVRCIDRLSVQHMQFLRHLYLSGLASLSEVGGWHGAPNLVSIKIRNCTSLQKIESMTSLHRLESVVLSNLQNCMFTIVKPGSKEEALSTCTSLQELTLTCTGLVIFPNFNSTSLRVLNLSSSSSLRRMKGSLGLTALEELYLDGCCWLMGTLDLQQLVRLRKLGLDNCGNLREVKLADAALTSLEGLAFINSSYFSAPSRSSPVPIDAFPNLHLLKYTEGGMISGHEGEDLGNVELPASLEGLEFRGVCRARELTCSSALVNLTKLYVVHCPSLRSITGLGAYFKLSKLNIWKCESLREVGHWEPPFNRYSMQSVNICNCPSLDPRYVNIPNFPSLTYRLLPWEEVMVPESEDEFKI